MIGRTFRVWDKRYKQYVKPYAVCLDGRAIVITEPCNDLETLDSERAIIEFGTGIKDKNGKEICEGDIVEYATCHYGNEKRHRKVVEWEEWDSDDFGEPHNLGYFNLSEYMTVIGNINENPELLEEE